MLEIYARTKPGKSYALTLEPTLTVYDAKLAVQAQSRLDPASFKLTLRGDGDALPDGATLEDVGVLQGYTLHVLLPGEADWPESEDAVPAKCCVVM
jgi:hypothetical protein